MFGDQQAPITYNWSEDDYFFIIDSPTLLPQTPEGPDMNGLPECPSSGHKICVSESIAKAVIEIPLNGVPFDNGDFIGDVDSGKSNVSSPTTNATIAMGKDRVLESGLAWMAPNKKRRKQSPSHDLIVGHCTCKKNRCLKMYCKCFQDGEPCGDKCKCNTDLCQNTRNNDEAETRRVKRRGDICSNEALRRFVQTVSKNGSLGILKDRIEEEERSQVLE